MQRRAGVTAGITTVVTSFLILLSVSIGAHVVSADGAVSRVRGDPAEVTAVNPDSLETKPLAPGSAKRRFSRRELISQGVPGVATLELSVNDYLAIGDSPPEMDFLVRVTTPKCGLTIGPFTSVHSDSGVSEVRNAGFDPEAWSRDGAWVAIPFRQTMNEDETTYDIYLVNLNSCRITDSISGVLMHEMDFSPDSRYLVYSDMNNLGIVTLATMERQKIQIGDPEADNPALKDFRWVDTKHSLVLDFYPNSLDTVKVAYRVILKD